MNRIGLRTLGLILLGFGLIGAAPSSSLADSESWDAVYLKGTKVGYIWVKVEPVKDGDKQLVRVRVDWILEFKRGNDIVRMEMQYGTIETPEGEVLRLDTKVLGGQQVLRVYGDVIKGKMKLKIENGDQQQDQVIEWTADTFGPYGVEMSLARQSIKPGETRLIKTFIPNLNKIGQAHLSARGVEQVPLGGGVVRELLRVDQEISVDNGKKMPEMNMTLWIDPNGQVLKTYTDTDGGMTTYRTTKAAAMKGGAKLDLIAASTIKMAKKITNPESTRGVTYKLTMSDANPAEIFPNDRRQTIKPGTDPNSAILTVATAGMLQGEAGPDTVAPEFLNTNPLITCTDDRVIRHAREAVGRETDSWAKAQAITKWVFKKVKNKNFETGFAPADEVARTLSGDCTEHAVLTAAMCRAEGVPARVATGLVYASSLGGFGFHMWNEVYVNRRWVAIDSAFDETDVDAVHLKLSDSSLDGVSPFETFLPVSRVFGKLKIEVIEIR